MLLYFVFKNHEAYEWTLPFFSLFIVVLFTAPFIILVIIRFYATSLDLDTKCAFLFLINGDQKHVYMYLIQQGSVIIRHFHNKKKRGFEH